MNMSTLKIIRYCSKPSIKMLLRGLLRSVSFQKQSTKITLSSANGLKLTSKKITMVSLTKHLIEGKVKNFFISQEQVKLRHHLILMDRNLGHHLEELHVLVTKFLRVLQQRLVLCVHLLLSQVKEVRVNKQKLKFKS